ncbi:MAG: hypothetical protein MZU95_12240 [Desulfomicrobium escambiense]|nr:hypothetical protein [Desulfomicrobium escambiense]
MWALPPSPARLIRLSASGRKNKRKNANAGIVIGGNHATYDPDYFNRAEFDYIAIGLGKEEFL